MAASKDVKEYASTLQDLTFNSKPLINALTMLAEENSAHAKEIVEVIESYLKKVRIEVKLPVMYLIDCIMKNVGEPYTSLFCENLVPTFCLVFEMVDEKTRAEMFKLRMTWNEIIPSKKLYALDVQINLLDPAWPVTAAPPSIHFNPKFLKQTGPPAAVVKKDGAVKPPIPSIPVPIVANQSSLDPATLDMQKKLIQKQQELLELQQKKIELELLQTQVKIQQEQLKSKNLSDKPEPTNILLKPEVAKQLVSNVPVSIANNILPTAKIKNTTGSSMLMKNKAQNNTTGTRINPVSIGLISARPIRDPRLLRHQPSSNPNNINSNMNIENKTLIPPSIDNKVIVNNNRMSVRDNRVEPRLANNKDTLPQNQGKTKSQPRIPKLSHSKNTDSYKPNKTSTTRSNKNESPKNSSSNVPSSPSKRSEKSNDSPVNRSPLKQSLSKNKKKDSPSKIDKKSEKNSKSSSKSDKERKSPQKCDTSPTIFKDVKRHTKNRNYVRRNRAISISPEPSHDVDLRLGGPPDKIPRLQGESIDKSTNDAVPLSQPMDVDFRKLSEPINKKRLSTEVIESVPAKRSKSEIMDELFGSEDTDLRQLPPSVSPTKLIEKPITPPPPIISDDSNLEVNKENKKESPKRKAELDLVREKLARTKQKLLMTEDAKATNNHEDVDLRNVFSNIKDTKINSKIFISQDDEHKIKSGNMTKDQEAALFSKIMAKLENQMLMEAKLKDKSEVEKLANTSLQPISDEELDDDMHEVEGEDTFSEFPRDRIPPPPPNIGQPGDYGKFPRRMDHIRPNWRGNRRGRHPMGMPMPRPGIRGPRGIEPWIRPPFNGPNQGPWRSMVPPNFVKGPINENFAGPDIPEHSLLEQGGNSPSMFENSQDAPNLVVSTANQDNIKSINIDGLPRDIRYYDETAIAFMNWDDPREISFQDGSRRVIFDDKDSFILNFNESYTDVIINGKPHKIRLGAPSREIFIDGNGYECYFGSNGIGIEMDGKITSVKIDGPPPQVKIGAVPRTDLVGGKINLIIDAKNVIPIFLDGKVQKFEVEGKTHTLQFTDALCNVLINDIPFKVEFGGLPKPFIVDGNKHFIRFSVLPKGIRPGHVNIKDMRGSRVQSPVDEMSQDGLPNIDTTEPALPIMKKKKVPIGAISPDHNSNSAFPFQSLLPPAFSHLDVLSSVITSSLAPSTAASGYSVGNTAPPEVNSSEEAGVLPSAPAPVNPILPMSLNINELFQKLVENGIVSTVPSVQDKKPAVPSQLSPSRQSFNKNKNIKPVFFDKPDTLKTRQPALIQTLHSGMQCSSCGMRFPPEHSKQYSQHLDWHFRQNRKGKKNIRKASSRRWYYGLADWKNYEEVEDVDDKEKNYFDQQQAQGEGINEEGEEEIEIPSVVADPLVSDPRCEVCQDRFEQFYNEEKEEWHLRMAMRVDDKTYHPLCYEDYEASLQALEESMNGNNIPGLEASVEIVEEDKIPEEIIIDDDDEESASNLSKNSPSSNFPEESSDVKNENLETTENKKDEEEEDDDVIINEIVPERIILDDDDNLDDEVSSESVDNFASIKEEPVDDGFVDVADTLKLGEIKIKTEPIDPDEILDISVEENGEDNLKTDTTHPDVVPLIDGNVETGMMPQSSGLSGKIKINITKPIPVLTTKDNKDLANSEIDNTSPEIIDPSQPLPPGEENIQLNLKPALQGLKLKNNPSVQKGLELTSLCSIM